jgi:hypothetical protein
MTAGQTTSGEPLRRLAPLAKLGTASPILFSHRSAPSSPKGGLPVFYSRSLILNPDLICETHTAIAKARSTTLADRPFRLKTGVERQAR